MLIHLTPRYYARYNDVHVDIIDVEIPELKLILKANVDIIMRAPFPNKNYKVVCRKKGRKAINGILIEIDGELKNFTVISRWAVNGEISRHETYYHVTDNEFDAVTEEDFLWSGFFNTPYRTRCKEIEVGGTLVKRQSAMVTLIDDLNSNDGDNYWTYNKVDGEGFVRFRSEYIMLPTVERERITYKVLLKHILPLTTNLANITRRILMNVSISLFSMFLLVMWSRRRSLNMCKCQQKSAASRSCNRGNAGENR
ncbi:hypothetical protein ABM88_002541, partial [Salmonella enterica subsp. enterica serovar Minnesota]|nr:hypothetical protein [Salmonella enterica subsp. enterica serovar Minnesota]